MDRVDEFEERLLRVQSGGDESARRDAFPPDGLHADGASAFDDDAGQIDAGAYLASRLFHSGHQGLGESRRSAKPHLRLAIGGQQRRDVMPEPGGVHVDFAQSVEK